MTTEVSSVSQNLILTRYKKHGLSSKMRGVREVCGLTHRGPQWARQSAQVALYRCFHRFVPSSAGSQPTRIRHIQHYHPSHLLSHNLPLPQDALLFPLTLFHLYKIIGWSLHKAPLSRSSGYNLHWMERKCYVSGETPPDCNA